MTGAFYNDPNHLYGNSAYHYDDAPSTFEAERLLWRLEFAWSGNLIYWSDASGRNDADRLIDMSYVAGRPTLVNYDGVGLSRWTPGRLIVTLVNDDFRFDPTNASSPYYPNIKPGVFCRLGVRRAADDSCNWRFTGMITNVRCYQDPQDRANYAEISIVDGWGFLQNKSVYLPTVQNANMTSILSSILTAAGYPWGSLTDGGTLNYPYYWCGGDDVYTNIQKVAEAQGDRIWIGGDGILHTEARTAASLLIASITQDKVLVNIPRTNPWESLWNAVNVQVLSAILMGAGNYSLIWGDVPWLGGPGTSYVKNTTEQVLTSGTSQTISGKYSDQGLTQTGISQTRSFLAAYPTTGFSTLIDYDWWTGSGSTGTKKTGSVVVTSFLDGGDAFQVTFLNNHTATLYSSNMTIEGFEVVSVPAGTQNFKDDRSAGAPVKTFSIQTPYLHGTLLSDGAAIAKYYADIVAVNRTYPTITIERRSTLQFLNINDRVNIALTKYSISSDYRVGQIQERWLGKNGQGVQTTITPEPYVVATG